MTNYTTTCPRCGKTINLRSCTDIMRVQKHTEVYDDIHGYRYMWAKDKTVLCSKCTDDFNRFFMSRENFKGCRVFEHNIIENERKEKHHDED